MVSHVRVRLRVPHDHLRVLLHPGHDRHGRELGRVLDALVGVDVAEEDVVVGVQLRRHRLEADRRTAGADLQVDAGVDAAGRDQRAGDGDAVLVDRVAVADHVVDPAVLGLGVPVGLDDDGLRAVRRQVDVAGRSAAAGRAGRRRWSPVVVPVAAVVAVASPPVAVVSAAGASVDAASSSSSSPPHAARARAPASGTASQRLDRRMCIKVSPCRGSRWWLTDCGRTAALREWSRATAR